MKTRVRVILFVMLASILAVGFAPRPQSVSIKIGTATAGGVWNPLGVALGELITRHVPGVAVTAQTTGGAIENLKLLAAGKLDLALAYDYHVAWLNAGKLPSVADGKKPVRILLGLYEHPLHIVARQGAGIAGVMDLKGKRVSTGAVDSGVEEQAGFVFKALGLDWDKDLTREKLGPTESAAALKEGKLDAFFWSGAVPSESAPTAIATLAADPAVKMVVIPVSGAGAEAILKANPAVFHRTTIKKGEYTGLNADVETIAVTAVLTAMDTFPADRAGAILEAVFGFKTELTSVWKGAAGLTPEKNVAVLAAEARQYLHPAAAAVFQDRETLYQVSPYSALAAGRYEGFKTAGWLKERGDVGMGTFDGLDGEMIVVDGQVYQARDTGAVVPMPDSASIPFATITRFDDDIVMDAGPYANLAALHAAMDKLMVRKDSFYAIRIEGTFASVQVRSIPKQDKPYVGLTEALKKQVVFNYQNIKGTAVGVWSPEYIGGILTPGYHLHWISSDRVKGGHMLDGALAGGQVHLDETRNLALELNPGSQ